MSAALRLGDLSSHDTAMPQLLLSNFPLCYLSQELRNKYISSLYSFPSFLLFYILIFKDGTYTENKILAVTQKINRNRYAHIQYVFF